MAAQRSTAIRRLLNRLIGRGPYRLAPFETIARDLISPTAVGVHQPESFTGVVRRESCVVHSEEGGAQSYAEPRSLLGQPPSWEIIGGAPRYRGHGVAVATPKVLYSLCDAGIAGADGVVYDPHSRRAVEETVRCWVQPGHSHPLLGAVNLPEARKLDGVSLSLASLDSEGFYHFLHEALPRLWLARDFRANLVRVLVSGTGDAQREAWLGRAGVPAGQIVWLGGLSHFRCEQLLFTNVPLGDYQPTAWNIGALRGLLKPPTAGGKRWLWISRSDARARRLTWEDALLRRFPRFEKIVLGALSPAEQMRLFAEAAVVAGPHGAGLAQLAFCPSGGRLVELFPPGNRQPIYARLAQAAGMAAAWAMVDFNQPADLEPLVRAMDGFLSAGA